MKSDFVNGLLARRRSTAVLATVDATDGVGRARRAVGLIRLPRGRGLQLDDRLPDAKPDALPVVLAAFEHLIGSPACHDLGVHTMFADQQIGGSPRCRGRGLSSPIRLGAFVLWASWTDLLCIRYRDFERTHWR
jgi:hypothetical protein